MLLMTDTFFCIYIFFDFSVFLPRSAVPEQHPTEMPSRLMCTAVSRHCRSIFFHKYPFTFIEYTFDIKFILQASIYLAVVDSVGIFQSSQTVLNSTSAVNSKMMHHCLTAIVGVILPNNTVLNGSICVILFTSCPSNCRKKRMLQREQD